MDPGTGRLLSRGALLGLAAALAWTAGARGEGPRTPVAPAIGREVIGREVAIAERLRDGEELTLPVPELIERGRQLFAAMWTVEEGAGRPLTKGTGDPVSDPSAPLVFPRNFNRVGGPDANSCAGCHNAPFGIPGGSGDVVANVFVLAQRFDHPDFADDPMATRGGRDETGRPVSLDTVGNSRKTVGMFGAGYIEMLARQMTAELQAIRDAIPPGGSSPLVAKGVSFGILRRAADGRWNTFGVEGLPPASLSSFGSEDDPPSLVVRPWHQAGALVSLRMFTNNALNHHHGIQSVERFGAGQDLDGDGVANEIGRAEVTALTLYQAAMAVPGRVIPRVPEIEQANLMGERKFAEIGCAGCHVPRLPLTGAGHVYVEPGPYNPKWNLRRGEAPPVAVDLNSHLLPLPRLAAEGDVTWVPAYTDLKLHDITSGAGDPNREPLDMQQPPGSKAFLEGNGRFLTRRLWGIGNQGPYFHHGKFTTLREAVLAHAGEAEPATAAFRALPAHEQDCVIEFLKSLRVLPPGTRALVVDEAGRARPWPAAQARIRQGRPSGGI